MKNINDYKINEELINEGLFSAIKRFFDWLFDIKTAEFDNDGEIISRFNSAVTINDLKDAGVVFNNQLDDKLNKLGNRIKQLEKKDINNLNKNNEKIDYSKIDVNNKSMKKIIFIADVSKNINKVLNSTKSSNNIGFSNIYKFKTHLQKEKNKNKLNIKYYAVFITNSNIAFLCQVVKNYWDVNFSNVNQYSGFAHIIYDTQKYFESGENHWITYMINYIQNLNEYKDVNGFTTITDKNSKNINSLKSECNFIIDENSSKGENVLLYKRIKPENKNNNKKDNNKEKDNNKKNDNKIDFSELDLTDNKVLNQLELKESHNENDEKYKSLNSSIKYENPINSYYDIYYTTEDSNEKKLACTAVVEYMYWKNSKNKNDKYENYAHIKLQPTEKFKTGSIKWLEYLLMNVKDIKTTFKDPDNKNAETQIEGLTINKNDNDDVNDIISKYSFELDSYNDIFAWKNPEYKEEEKDDEITEFAEENIKTEKITEQLRKILKQNGEDFQLIRKLRSNRKVENYDFYGIYDNENEDDKKLIGIYLIENGYWNNEIDKHSDDYDEDTLKNIKKLKDYINIYIDIKEKYKDIKPDAIVKQIEKSVSEDIKGITISDANKLVAEYLINEKYEKLSIKNKNDEEKELYIKSLSEEETSEEENSEEKNSKEENSEEENSKEEDKKDDNSNEEVEKLNVSISDIKKNDIDESFTFLNKVKNTEKIASSDIHDYTLTKDDKTLCAFLVEYNKWKHIADKIEIIEEGKNKTKIRAKKQDKENISNLNKFVNIYFEVNNEFKNNKKELFDTTIKYVKRIAKEKWNGVSVLQADEIKDILSEENFNTYEINLKIQKENADKEEDTNIKVYYKLFDEIKDNDNKEESDKESSEKNESISVLKKYATSINEHLSIYDYYKYYKSINEELDENILWKLDKWFEMNEEQESEFIGILAAYKTNKNIKSLLRGTKLYDNIKEFVNFLNDDININNEIDYIYQFGKILATVSNNKSNENKYFIV